MTYLRTRRSTPVTVARDRVVDTLESARRQIDQQFDDAEREVDRLARRVDRRYRMLRRRVRDSRDTARKRLDEEKERVEHRALAVRHGVENRLREHPVALPAAAGAVGFLAGLAVAGRKEVPRRKKDLRRKGDKR